MRSNMKSIFKSRKAKVDTAPKKKKSSKKSYPTSSRSRQKKKSDKVTGNSAGNKDGQKEPVFYELNMAHMMRRSDKHRGRQQQILNQQKQILLVEFI